MGLGVFDEALIELIGYALAVLNAERAVVAPFSDLDEIAPIDDSAVMYVDHGALVSKREERLPTNGADV